MTTLERQVAGHIAAATSALAELQFSGFATPTTQRLRRHLEIADELMQTADGRAASPKHRQELADLHEALRLRALAYLYGLGA